MAAADFPEHLPRLASIFAGGHEVSGIDEVEEVVGSAGAFIDIGLGGADIELAIHRDRIAVDDLALEFLRERQRQRRFSAGRRTKDHNQQRLGRGDLAFIQADAQRRLQWMSCQ